MDIEHKILLVDDEKSIGKSLGRTLEMEDFVYQYVQSAEEALEVIQSQAPFSLVISDHRMPGMQGAQFLEKVKENSADSIRFLLTAYSDIETITDSINKGSVHRYISKPWDTEELLDYIRAALKQFEKNIESRTLLESVKEQNKKLFRLDLELKNSTDRMEQEVSKLDQLLKNLQEQPKDENTESQVPDRESLIRSMEPVFFGDTVKTDLLTEFYTRSLRKLYADFETAANRNGFEMRRM